MFLIFLWYFHVDIVWRARGGEQREGNQGVGGMPAAQVCAQLEKSLR